MINKNNKLKIIICLVIIILIIALAFYFINKNKSNNSTGIVKEKALELYNQKKAEGMIFSSQCLGTIYVNNIDYAVDIVHVPRTSEDNLLENQCQDFREGKVNHFIELDKDGNVVRTV